MELPTLEINGRDVSFGSIWVHLQRGDSPDARSFTHTVPSRNVQEIFDPHGNCSQSVRLKTYLMELIFEFGTFVVGGYVESIRKLLNVEGTRYEWVIATVESVEDTEMGLVIRGKAVPFVPKPAPKFKNLL
jgi:hypothetical protein